MTLYQKINSTCGHSTIDRNPWI